MTATTVWLASYPKSGSTWLRAVCSAWRDEAPVDLDRLVGHPIAASRESFDVALGVPSSRLSPAEVDVLRPRADELVASEAEGPLLRKIHDAFLPGPGQEPIVSAAATRGALYVIRDPRAVAVSYARHAGRRVEWVRAHMAYADATVSAGGRELPDQLRQRLGTWSQHVRSWVDEAPFPVEVVRYEDFTAAPLPTFARALRFAGLPATDDARLAEAVRQAAFDRLRRAEHDHGFREMPAGEDRFFRRGEPESWREELPAELAAQIEEDHGGVMERFGYR